MQRRHTGYDFLTVWRFAAPLHRVWDEIYHSERWPHWWRGLESVAELEQGDDRGIGNVRRYAWKGGLPYRLTFDVRTVRIDEMVLLAGEASGDLEGTGVWHFASRDAMTEVRHEWRVRTTKWWMNALAPVAGWLFRRNHDAIMAGGARGLAERLQAPIPPLPPGGRNSRGG